MQKDEYHENTSGFPLHSSASEISLLFSITIKPETIKKHL